LGWDAAKVLAPLGDRATAWNDLDKMVQAIVQASQPGDAIVVMSNGSFGGIHQRLLDQLSR
jgi:UDP-N-acetylmuramate: L-alanyl-gamma-D-glutamyl-meso-diaminopimelate ligase